MATDQPSCQAPGGGRRLAHTLTFWASGTLSGAAIGGAVAATAIKQLVPSLQGYLVPCVVGTGVTACLALVAYVIHAHIRLPRVVPMDEFVDFVAARAAATRSPGSRPRPRVESVRSAAG